MKTFIFTEKSRTISRTYGGSNYTLAVYEVKNANTINHIGNVSACTRGHKGEISEAWDVVFNHLPKRLQNKAKRLSELPENKNLNLTAYYSWNYTPKMLGITLKEV